jgi:hypothetical protein
VGVHDRRDRAIAFTSAIVASAVVIGWITDEVIVPILDAGAPTDGRLRAAVLLLFGVGVWKAAGIVVRRTAAGWLQAGAQARCGSGSSPTSSD